MLYVKQHMYTCLHCPGPTETERSITGDRSDHRTSKQLCLIRILIYIIFTVISVMEVQKLGQ